MCTVCILCKKIIGHYFQCYQSVNWIKIIIIDIHIVISCKLLVSVHRNTQSVHRSTQSVQRSTLYEHNINLMWTVYIMSKNIICHYFLYYQSANWIKIGTNDTHIVISRKLISSVHRSTQSVHKWCILGIPRLKRVFLGVIWLPEL